MYSTSLKSGSDPHGLWAASAATGAATRAVTAPSRKAALANAAALAHGVGRVWHEGLLQEAKPVAGDWP